MRVSEIFICHKWSSSQCSVLFIAAILYPWIFSQNLGPKLSKVKKFFNLWTISRIKGQNFNQVSQEVNVQERIFSVQKKIHERILCSRKNLVFMKGFLVFQKGFNDNGRFLWSNQVSIVLMIKFIIKVFNNLKYEETSIQEWKFKKECSKDRKRSNLSSKCSIIFQVWNMKKQVFKNENSRRSAPRTDSTILWPSWSDFLIYQEIWFCHFGVNLILAGISSCILQCWHCTCCQ